MHGLLIYDHLGNTRVTYRNLFQCSVDENDGTGSYPTHYILKHLHDYFPYGKTLREWYATNEDTERFQTTHHQRDTETTLDHRGARFYDADVGRFLSLDPLAADYPSWSDYNYVLGNPVIFVDPDGKNTVYYDEEGNELFYSYDDLDDAITIIPSNKLYEFYKTISRSIYGCQEHCNSSNIELRSIGATYLYKSITSFHERNKDRMAVDHDNRVILDKNLNITAVCTPLWVKK